MWIYSQVPKHVFVYSCDGVDHLEIAIHQAISQHFRFISLNKNKPLGICECRECLSKKKINETPKKFMCWRENSQFCEVYGIAIDAKCVGASVAAISLDVYVNIKLTYGHMDDLLNLQIWWPCFMAGQPTHPTYSNPPQK